jgi:hypothetical protein
MARRFPIDPQKAVRLGYYISLLRAAMHRDEDDPIGYANHVYAIATQQPHFAKDD